MNIPILFWTRHAATATGRARRVVRCEECGGEYAYEIERAAVGHGISVYALDEDGAAKRARKEAQEHLVRQLDAEIEVVPCPKCGWVQTGMTPLARRQYRRWMDTTGWVVALLAVTAAFANMAMGSGAPPRRLLVAWPWVIVAGVLGPALVLLRLALANAYEPNDEPVEVRIERGRKRSVAVEADPARDRNGA
ncbi:MAG TPA: hypothetical protein VFY93_18775 [Planctomycetota bacterium]|nr:hypothetical protein [Planctomycetota bacterium]